MEEDNSLVIEPRTITQQRFNLREESCSKTPNNLPSNAHFYFIFKESLVRVDV